MTAAQEMNAATREPGAADGVLAEPEWLAAHLHHPTVQVVEVDVSRAAHDEGHIPGAVLWNVYTDLKDAGYRLADSAAVRGAPGPLRDRPGLDGRVLRVRARHGFLARQALRPRRRADPQLLARRVAGGRPPVEQLRGRTGPHRLHPSRAERQLRATRQRCGRHRRPGRGAGRRALEAEYRGERFWPSGGLEPGGRAGHVPSAVHQPIDGLYDARGQFRAAADLRGVFSAVDLDGDNELITYCTIGGRACTAWFVLTYLLGRGHVRVYDGSWAEWGRMAGTPVAQDARG